MSINFFCPDAPTHLVTPDADEPDVQAEQSTLPCLNLSQANGYAFLRLMDLPEQCEGCLSVADIPAARQKLLLVTNSKKTRALERMPYCDSNVPGKARVIEVGVPDEYFERRATQMLDLLAKAQEHGHNVVWS
jgi:hypothetical protein